MNEKEITVKELIDKLKKFPENMKVITSYRSCYQAMFEPTTVTCFKTRNGWLEKFYPNQFKDEEEPKVEEYVYFEGN